MFTHLDSAYLSTKSFKHEHLFPHTHYLNTYERTKLSMHCHVKSIVWYRHLKKHVTELLEHSIIFNNLSLFQYCLRHPKYTCFPLSIPQWNLMVKYERESFLIVVLNNKMFTSVTAHKILQLFNIRADRALHLLLNSPYPNHTRTSTKLKTIYTGFDDFMSRDERFVLDLLRQLINHDLIEDNLSCFETCVHGLKHVLTRQCFSELIQLAFSKELPEHGLVLMNAEHNTLVNQQFLVCVAQGSLKNLKSLCDHHDIYVWKDAIKMAVNRKRMNVIPFLVEKGHVFYKQEEIDEYMKGLDTVICIKEM